MRSIKQVLMERDGLTKDEAHNLINDARQDFHDRLANGESYIELEDICNEWFGLEPDYIDELM